MVTSVKRKGYCLAVIFSLLYVLIFTSCIPTGGRPGNSFSSEGEIIPRHQRSGLAILKFINSTSNEKADYFQPWEYGIAAMLTTDIEQTGMFNIVDRERLNDILEEQRLQATDLFDQSTAVSIGKMVSAEYILTGTFMVVENNLKIMGQVFSVEKGIQLGAVSAVGATEQFFMVEKELFEKVSDTLSMMLDTEKKRKILASIETKSVDASLNNYSGEIAMLKAEEMKKRGDTEKTKMYNDEAKNKFREALKADPKYKRAKENLSRLQMAIPMTL